MPSPSRIARVFSCLAWAMPGAMLALLTAAAIFAPWIAPQDPYDLASVRLEDADRPPVWRAATPLPSPDHGAAAPVNATAPATDASAATPNASSPRRGVVPMFLLGADGQGRDVLSSVCYGLRVSLLVGLGGTLLAGLAGVALGLVAGWKRGWIDAALMRLADVQLAFPSILIALFLMAAWGQGVGKIVVAVAIAHWVIYARVTRASVLAEREKDYVAAAQALGAGTCRVLLRHLLPNVLTPVLIISAVEFASVVMLEATLSFLGLGVPVTRPSLGMLVKFGYDDFFGGTWWTWLFPGAALALLILSVNWLADLLRARHQLPGQN